MTYFADVDHDGTAGLSYASDSFAVRPFILQDLLDIDMIGGYEM